MIDSQFGFEVSFIKKSFIEYAIMIITVTKSTNLVQKLLSLLSPINWLQTCATYFTFRYVGSMYLYNLLLPNKELYGNNVLYIFIKFFDVATKRLGKVLQVPNLRIFMAEIFCPSHVGYSAANMWKHSIPTSFMKNSTCRWEQVHPFILTLRQGCSMFQNFISFSLRHHLKAIVQLKSIKNIN